MGLKPDEVKRMTLGEFNLMYTGYNRRIEKQYDMTRRIMATVISFGGMGLKDGKVMQPWEVLELPMDSREETKKIRTYEQALALLNSF